MNSEIPIVIYQMGKVGSQTIKELLEQFDLPNPIYHIHLLSSERLNKSIETRISQNLALTVQQNYGKKLREYIDLQENPSLKVITAVREPIIQLISSVFQKAEFHFPHFINSDGSYKFQEIHDYLSQLILNYKAHNPNQNCNWFDNEFKSALEIDVYEHEFNRITGYSLIAKENIDILILRLENSDIWNPVITDFLEQKNCIKKIVKNSSSKKKYGDVYKKIISELKFPISVLKRIYSSKYCQHFYTQEMIDGFIARWSV